LYRVFQTEDFPDLKAIQDERSARQRAAVNAMKRTAAQTEKEARKQREADAELKSYKSLFEHGDPAGATSNKAAAASADDDAAEEFEDDFM